MNVGDAGLVIVTIDDFKAIEQVVALLHRMHPSLDILARGHDQEHCQRLYAKGAWLVVSENLEASIALAGAALDKVNAGDEENDAAGDRFRAAYHADTRTTASREPQSE
jgi:voltage-gated potassium channel Kch